LPTLARWHIKTALAWLVAGLALGVVSYLPLGGFPSATFAPVYVHLLVVGWLTQLVFGVAYWMFPKASLEKPRGHEGLALATYALLNLGMAARAVGEPMLALAPGETARGLVVASAVLQWLAVMAFVANTWPRVRGT
jgi:hypothetical protein